jgi:hypothetical protein
MSGALKPIKRTSAAQELRKSPGINNLANTKESLGRRLRPSN